MSSEKPNLKQLIALADAMLIEKGRERQEAYDAVHPEYEGTIQAASPLDSAERTYQFYRVRWSDELGLPNAMETLRGTS